MGAPKIDILRHIRVGVKLIGGFTFMACITLLAGGVGVYGVWSVGENARQISQVGMPTLNNLLHLQQTLAEFKAAQRTLLIPGLAPDIQANQIRQLDGLRARSAKAVEQLDGLTRSTPGQRQWEKVKGALAALRESETPFLNANRENDLARMNELVFGVVRERQTEAQNLLDSLEKVVSGQLEVDADKAQGKSRFLFWGTLGGMVSGTLLALFMGLHIAWDSVRPLRKLVSFAKTVGQGKLDEKLNITRRDDYGELAEGLRVMVANLKAKILESSEKSAQAEDEARRALEATDAALASKAQAERTTESLGLAARQLDEVVAVVNAASGQINTQVELASQGAAAQSSRVAETAAAMSQMNATVLEVARNAALAVESAEAARQMAGEGSRVVDQVVAGISAMQQASSRLQEDMATLSRQAEGIGQIMNVISDIADQTNLLALNAAIEAARAGDAGRGFAVVADEVRKLAEKTMTATKEVGETIRGIQSGARRNQENVELAVTNVGQATGLALESGKALSEIVRLVEVSSDQIRSIAAASEEQSAASEQISSSIEDISRISRETAEAMRQSSQAVGDMAGQATVLRSLVERMMHSSQGA
jgi:methyl-accepting chemotaxis protein